MIFGETASVCALPAPVKPKRCFRSPLRHPLPFPWPALGLTFPIAFSIWAMKQQENALWAVAGSGKMCRFPQPATRRGSWKGGEEGKVCRKNLNTTCIFHMTRQLFIIPLNPPCHQPVPQLILARRLSTLQPEDVDSCCCCCCCCRGWGCDVTGGC